MNTEIVPNNYEVSISEDSYYPDIVSIYMYCDNIRNELGAMKFKLASFNKLERSIDDLGSLSDILKHYRDVTLREKIDECVNNIYNRNTDVETERIRRLNTSILKSLAEHLECIERVDKSQYYTYSESNYTKSSYNIDDYWNALTVEFKNK